MKAGLHSIFPSCWCCQIQNEGWPQLNVETEANGDSKSTNERGPSIVG